MATRRYKISPGMTEFQVIEEVGAANNSHVIEVTVDLAALVNDGGINRTVLRSEVEIALDQIENHIISGIWPPA